MTTTFPIFCRRCGDKLVYSSVAFDREYNEMTGRRQRALFDIKLVCQQIVCREMFDIGHNLGVFDQKGLLKIKKVYKEYTTK